MSNILSIFKPNYYHKSTERHGLKGLTHIGLVTPYGIEEIRSPLIQVMACALFGIGIDTNIEMTEIDVSISNLSWCLKAY